MDQSISTFRSNNGKQLSLFIWILQILSVRKGSYLGFKEVDTFSGFLGFFGLYDIFRSFFWSYGLANYFYFKFDGIREVSEHI